MVFELKKVDDFVSLVFVWVCRSVITKLLASLRIRGFLFGRFLASFLTVMFSFYLFAHIFACLFILIEGFDIDTFDENEYINAIYFVYSTSTVVGYGDVTIDISSKYKIEIRILFSILVIFFGIIFVGYTFGCINQTLAEVNQIELKVNAELGGFEGWIAIRRKGNPEAFSFKFEMMLKRFYLSLFRYNVSRVIRYNNLIAMLPEREATIVTNTSTRELLEIFRHYFADLSEETAEEMVMESSSIA